MFPEQSGCFPLHFMERAKRQKAAKEPRREFIFGNDQPQPYRKSALLLGPRGSGKTALVNSFANFINNVVASSPYRLHITPINDKVSPNSSMNYASTQTVSSYIFHHTPIGMPIALIDTPSLGKIEDESPNIPTSSVNQIKQWVENDYGRPLEELEIWFVISAVDSDVSPEAEEDLQTILDLLHWKAKLIPIVTFAKRRKPILALKALGKIGIECEIEGVDYFTINNGSVLGLSSELLEMNALSFEECIDHMRSILISHEEPAVSGSLVPLHVSTSPEKSPTLKHSDTSDSARSSEVSTPSPDEPLRRAPSEDSSVLLSSLDQLVTPQHRRLRSHDASFPTAAALSTPEPRQRQSSHPPKPPVAAPRHRRMVSHDSGLSPPVRPPSYDRVLGMKTEVEGRCKSEDVEVNDHPYGFVSISPYETLV